MVTIPTTDLMAKKEPQPAQERRLKLAASMATYLRSALGRTSEKLTPVATYVIEKMDHETTAEDNQACEEDEAREEEEEEAEEEKKPDEEEVEEKERALSGECDTASSGGLTEDQSELQEGEIMKETETFVVHIDRLASDTPIETGPTDKNASEKTQWGYCDVLLQPDAHGLGLNLRVVSPPPAHFPHKTTSVVTVASFRRLHDRDVGPAEASRQIHVGDVLFSIDGHHVHTLEAVAATLLPAPQFVLLRFLRPTVTRDRNMDVTTLLPPPPRQPLTNDDLWSTQPDVAMLIRELVVKNQQLHVQLISSQLKQDEQRIQLEQLHALYAKTQLDNWSAFSLLPKPSLSTSIRAPFNLRKSSSDISKSQSSSTLSKAAARMIGGSNSSGNNGSSYDVEFAVNAERERLTKQFEQRLEMEKHELQQQHDAALQVLQLASEKKMRMLEFAVHQLLQETTTSTTTGQEITQVSPHVHLLRHQLLHGKPSQTEQTKDTGETEETEDRNTRHDCVLCLLLRAETQHNSVAETTALEMTELENWQTQLQGVLQEYQGLQATRKQQWTEQTQNTERSSDT